MDKIIILGSTGSIGTRSLSIIKEYGGYEVLALSCGHNTKLLSQQIEEFHPQYVSTMERNIELENKYQDITFYYGREGLNKLASLDIKAVLLNALVGSSGLEPSLLAIKSHKKVLLSNKESLVIGGEIVKDYLSKYNGTLYPIDSEHTGLWELIDEYGKDNILSYTITASGGAFRDYAKEEMYQAKAKEALKHPNWSMGQKITIDSATLMNKGFEIIEAHYLFDIDYSLLKAVIQKDSLVHAYVTLKDGSIKMAVGEASMNNPIIRALYYPLIRYKNKEVEVSKLKFEEIDYDKYPCFNLTIEMGKRGGLYPTLLNASNEESVYLYLKDKISLEQIYLNNKDVCDKYKRLPGVSLENILKYDKIVKEFIKNKFV